MLVYLSWHGDRNNIVSILYLPWFNCLCYSQKLIEEMAMTIGAPREGSIKTVYKVYEILVNQFIPVGKASGLCASVV